MQAARPMTVLCTLLDSFLVSMIWCSSKCTNCSYKIVWHQLFACLFVSSPPNISHSRLEGWMMALHTRLATPPNSDEGQEKTERVVGSPRCSSSTCLHHPHHQNNHNHQHPHHHRLLTSLATLFKRQKK